MKISEAESYADTAYKQGRNILVLEMSTSWLGDAIAELAEGVEQVERCGWELVTSITDPSRTTPLGVFRRRDDFRTQR